MINQIREDINRVRNFGLTETKQHRINLPVKQNITLDIVDRDDALVIDILLLGKKIGYMTLEGFGDGGYTIVDGEIDPEFRRKGWYQSAILKLLEDKPGINIHSVFRSEDADRAWDSLIKKLPTNIGFKKVDHRDEDTIEFIIFNK